MAIKAIAFILGIEPATDPEKFKTTVKYVGLVDPYPDHFVAVDDISPGIAALALEEAIKDAVKNHLIATHGYTFGLLDSVRLLGATL